MAQRRTIVCDVCGAQYTERTHGEGFPGWGGLVGVFITTNAGHRIDNPDLCPKHKGEVAQLVCDMMEARN